MKRTGHLGLVATVIALVSACGSEDATGLFGQAGGAGTKDASTSCPPGKQTACACPGGFEGVQVCKSDGSGYGPCTGCKDPVDASAGGSGGKGGSGTGGGGGATSQGGNAGAGGNSQGGNSQGGNSQGGNSQGGNSQGGTAGASIGGSAGAATGGTGGIVAGGSAGAWAGGSDGGIDASVDSPADVAPEACVPTVGQATFRAVDMYFMIDSSGSMTGSPWQQETQALSTFWSDPTSAGIAAALRFFPYNDTCVAVEPQCLGDVYVKPAVPWGDLPAQASLLNAEMVARVPAGCTPTQEALNGVLRGAQARQIAQPGRASVAVMISDGAPCCGDCPVETDFGLGAIAAGYLGGTPSIRTFTLSVAPAASAVMTAIALSGGTQHAYDATDAVVFVSSLKAIHLAAIPCDVDLPGGTVNPNLVAVEYVAGGMPPATKLAHVDSEAQCMANDGWYFNNNTTPTRIVLCPGICSTAKSDALGKVMIATGCSSP